MKIVVTQCVFEQDTNMGAADFLDFTGDSDSTACLMLLNCRFKVALSTVLEVLTPLLPGMQVTLEGLEFGPGMAVVIDGSTVTLTGIPATIHVKAI